MDSKPVAIFDLPFRLTDAVTLGGLLLLTIPAAFFSGRTEEPGSVIAVNLVLAGVYAGSLVVLKSAKPGLLRFLVRTAVVQFTFLQVYVTGLRLQGLLSDWHDESVLAWEKAVFGLQPLLRLERFRSPWLSEWMFFVYVFYVAIYPILAAVIYFRRGEDANEAYLTRLGLVNLACALGFILYPVAGPMHWERLHVLLSKPFHSGFFAGLAEYIRTHIHRPGGTIPSPHAAVATVMWFMAFKYARRLFWLLAPVILSLYVSTVYGHFHYVSDTVIGIAVAVGALAAAPFLQKAWNRLAAGR